jgi:hypothetical protein
MGPSWRTSASAIVAAALTILYFVLDKWLRIQLPDTVLGAIGVLASIAIGSLGVNARDNRVTSEAVASSGKPVVIGSGVELRAAAPGDPVPDLKVPPS